MAPVSIRCLMVALPFRSAVTLHLSAGQTETPLAACEFSQGLMQLPAGEIRPEDLGEVQFRIGELPEKKIADAHFAAGPDEQVGVGLFGRVEKSRQNPVVDSLRVQAPRLALSASRRAARTSSLRAP